MAGGLGGMSGGDSPEGGWGAGLTGASGVNVSELRLGLDPAPPKKRSM